MTEENQFKAREGYQTINAEYIGLAEPPKTGTNAKGNTWTKNKVKFKKVGHDKEWTFTLWSPLTASNTQYKELSELEQFKVYNVVWAEKDEAFNGNEWVSKTIIVLKDEEEIKEATKTSTFTPTKTALPTAEELESFKQTYFEYCETNDKLTNTKSFLMQWFITKHADEVGIVFGFAKKNIANQLSKTPDSSGGEVVEEKVN